jgi:Iron-containing redox enzyme
VSATSVSTGESARLRSKLELALPLLVGTGRRLWEHRLIRDLYPEYLVANHGVIRASVPLMEATLERASAAAPHDPAAAGLAAYLEHHVDEERGHDDWLLEDLEVLGRSREEVLARPPSASVAALVGAQYYWIQYYHPVALLGYIGLLEGYPPTIADVEALMARTGHTREAFRTLIRHAELDPLHRQDFDEMLDRLPLSPEQSAVIGVSGLYSINAFTRVLEDVLEQAR